MLGACNDYDVQMRKCTKAERLARQEEAMRQSAERRRKVQERLTKHKREGKDWRDAVLELREIKEKQQAAGK